jgi:hypothetical protein
MGNHIKLICTIVSLTIYISIVILLLAKNQYFTNSLSKNSIIEVGTLNSARLLVSIYPIYYGIMKAIKLNEKSQSKSSLFGLKMDPKTTPLCLLFIMGVIYFIFTNIIIVIIQTINISKGKFQSSIPEWLNIIKAVILPLFIILLFYVGIQNFNGIFDTSSHKYGIIAILTALFYIFIEVLLIKSLINPPEVIEAVLNEQKEIINKGKIKKIDLLDKLSIILNNLNI